MNTMKRKAIEMTAAATPLTQDQVESALNNLSEWALLDDDNTLKLTRTFELSTASDATSFAREVAELGADLKYESDVHLVKKTVTVTWYSPDSKALSTNDFRLAAQTNDLYNRLAVITGERDDVEEASDESFPASDAPGW
jgi:4a-hydroxytetrahydrobiopterin dehydratase